MNKTTIIDTKPKPYLTKCWTTILLFYYSILLISSILLTIWLLGCKFDYSATIFSDALFGSLAMATVGSTIFYLRKLYKSSINNFYYTQSDIPSNYLILIGSIFYFVFRPIFAIAFSIIVILGIKSGFLIIAKEGQEAGNGLIFISMFFSFFVGFLAGSFIKKLEEYGDKIISKVF